MMNYNKGKKMKKLILTLVLTTCHLVNLNACRFCSMEMDIIEAKLEAAYKSGLMTETEKNCYANGFLRAVEIITENHPMKRN
jgi:hypothetical protein